MAVDLGTGTTITASGFTATVLSVNGPSFSRSVHNTSHLGTTTAHTFIPGQLYDAGEISLTIQHTGAETIPMTAAATNWVIDWGGSGNTDTVSGFLTAYTPSSEGGESESIMTADITIKCTGAIS